MANGPQSNKVFVVHGRNLLARNAMFDFLRAIGLNPIEWLQARGLTGEGSPHISTVLDKAFAAAQAIVVLLTPDDEARLSPALTPMEAGDETVLRQARPNVIFEAGLAFGRNPQRTILVQLGDLRPFSDIAGRLVVRLSDSAEARHELVERLRDAECRVDTSGQDWLRAGEFDVAERRYASGMERPPHASAASERGWVRSGQILLRANTPKQEHMRPTVLIGEAKNEGPLARVVSITATFKDVSGSIIGLASGTVAQLGRGEQKTFHLSSFDDLTGYTDMSIQVDYLI